MLWLLGVLPFLLLSRRLSFCCSSVGCVKHYLIALDSNTHEVTIDGVKYFSTLPDLVEVIEKIKLNNDANILVLRKTSVHFTASHCLA